MEHIAPLFQTLLWVALFGGIVWRFNKPFHGLLTALQHRIEAGSTVKVGPLEIIESLRSQAPEEQRAKLLEDLSESATTSADVVHRPQLSELPPTSLTEAYVQAGASDTVELKASYSRRPEAWLIAEDLALRAVQADYGQPIRRQVEFPSKVAVDGAFVLNGELHLVEVKALAANTSIISLIKKVRKIADAIKAQHLEKAHIVLVLVIDRHSYLASRDLQIRDDLSDLPVPVTVRSYSVKELRSRFFGDLMADES